MERRLLTWLLGNFNVPKSTQTQKQSILLFTFLIAATVVVEWSVDFPTSTLEILVPMLVANTCLTLIAFKKYSKWLGTAQLVVILVSFQLHIFLIPGSFHVIIYWMSIIPLVALLFGDVRSSSYWLIITIISMMADIVYGVSTQSSYTASITYPPYAAGGSIFCMTIVSCFYILHNLLGKAIQKLEKKNGEINSLNLELVTLNRNLEKIVRTRTSMIKNKNERLTKYAFMNSHLVRAPLANILGAMKIIEEAEDQKEVERLMDIVSLSASSLDEVIKQVALELRDSEDLAIN